ncbi:MAG: diheme cytochrome c-553 [Saprospiraceae bacterium]|nr:diheme cytochrome c-553 [Saprospiraceae bacterium]
MNNKNLIILLTFMVTLFAAGCAQKKRKPLPLTLKSPRIVPIKNGEYLVTILAAMIVIPKTNGANGPEIIPELMLSGYPSDRPLGQVTKNAISDGWALFNADLTCGIGPWGATFAGNLTPDETGIGNWSLEQFKTALTKGKYKGLDDGRMLLPPMPWINYVNMKDADVKAIYSYLMSIKPVKNVVSAPIPPGEL